MNRNLYQEAIEYEQLTQAIYQAIHEKEGSNVKVEHDVEVKGRSGVKHQIDVRWRFKLAGVEHTVLIECKNYASNLTLEKVRNFFGVLHDIGNANGIMVTKTGYQSGTTDFANHYGIGLKILRKPIESDWEGLVKDIMIELISKTPISTEEQPLNVQLSIDSTDEEKKEEIEKLIEADRLNFVSSPSLRFHDKAGNITGEELRWWLPKQLEALDKEEGGPYTQEIDAKEKYVLVNEGEADETLIPLEKIIVTYYVGVTNQEIAIYGEQIVDSILKDFNSSEVEYVKRKP